ncbi:DUF6572 domain-containing protein [Rhizobium sp. S96]|uniref:DUF6572 domain-containing protein n=1 Tax=Rhizobium sp. S96 TaxID=3055140 RepID=UPI0025AB2534|nr:DUF6572 domain-containing protein [Rhizobium sp. S96]MDM9622631.1 hypothetical protein [Rhizobium sp. S96]
MSIDQTEIIDFVSIEKSNGEVVLTISDHLPWEEDEEEHLLLLQEKINAYLRFIESGEMFRKVPRSEGRNIVIDVVMKFPLSPNAQIFLERAKAAVEEADFGLRWRNFQPN